MGTEVASLAMQVHGGMGYIEETGIAQRYRDIRIAAIYEGTNGIQAMDLVGRKLPMRAGGVIDDFLNELDADSIPAVGDAWPAAVAALREATTWILTDGADRPERCARGRDAVPAHVRHRGRRLGHGPPGDRRAARSASTTS